MALEGRLETLPKKKKGLDGGNPITEAIVASRACNPTLAPGIPTFERPVRNVTCPVIKAERRFDGG
jgi:hypothetical protein